MGKSFLEIFDKSGKVACQDITGWTLEEILVLARLQIEMYGRSVNTKRRNKT